MKHIYVIVFFLFVSLSYAQDGKAKGGIDGFQLYPNPLTSGILHISSAQNAQKKILIFDVLGTQVLETKMLGSELDLSELDAGVYVLRVYEKEKVVTRKLIIK